MTKSKNLASKLVFYFCVVSLIGVGILFRSWGVLTSPLDLWADEAWWATKMAQQSLFDLGVRPVAYMWLCKQLNSLSNAELMLRLPSYVCGIGFLCCMFICAKSLYKHYLTVLFCVFLAALHPKLIVFAKEFKPYSVELFLHSMFLLYLIRRYKTSANSFGLIGSSLTAGLFSYNLILLYPAIILVASRQKLASWLQMAIDKYNTCSNRQIFVLSLMASAVFLLLIVFIFLPVRNLFESQRLFWTHKYDVFPNELSVLGNLYWYVMNTLDLIAFPGMLYDRFHVSLTLIKFVFPVLFITGIYCLIRGKTYLLLAILLSTLIATLFANFLGMWPYGVFRTNLFLFPGIVLIIGFGLDKLVGKSPGNIPVMIAVLILMLLLLPDDFLYHKQKYQQHWAPSPQHTRVLDTILERYRQDNGYAANVILADWHTWRTFDYYINIDARGSMEFADIRNDINLIRGPLNGLNKLEKQLDELGIEDSKTRIWIAVTKLSEFSDIVHSDTVRQFQSYRQDYPTGDPVYYPMLIELGRS